MRIIPNEIQQVFKAYAKQLRVDHAKGNTRTVRDTRAKGFEKVEISEEARTLAASLPRLTRQAPTKHDTVDKNLEKDAELSEEKEEKASESTKASRNISRNKN